jgi:hypothetical protein
MNEPAKKELKSIDWSQQSFTANGKKYLLEKQVSIQRAVYAEAARIEMETGLRLGKTTESWQKIWNLLNDKEKSHFADISVIVYDHLRSFNNFLQDVHPVLKVAACFINEENEDRRIINDDIVNKKVEDWMEEGITMSSFFLLVLSFLRIEAEGLKSITDRISEIAQEVMTKLSTNELEVEIPSMHTSESSS